MTAGAQEITHRMVQTNGINMHVAELGEGPLVLPCHGFPESWFSWRHQMAALAGAGYHAVAPDQRGYGDTDRPEGSEHYSILHLVGDLVGLVRALGEQQAAVVGHDWGAPVACKIAGCDGRSANSSSRSSPRRSLANLDSSRLRSISAWRPRCSCV